MKIWMLGLAVGTLLSYNSPVDDAATSSTAEASNVAFDCIGIGCLQGPSLDGTTEEASAR